MKDGRRLSAPGPAPRPRAEAVEEGTLIETEVIELREWVRYAIRRAYRYGVNARRRRAKLAFRQTDVSRAIKAARAAGVEISRIEIDTGGPQSKITIIAGKPESQAKIGEGNEWDRL